MQSFRTELENPMVERDIIDLEKKIHAYRAGKMDEEKFRSLRLARGVYGQRQPGVQMVRIKIPFGKMTTRQLYRIADVSDEFSTGNLHLTTRQDIQIHYVSLDRTPELWAQLERDQVTLREACGNTVRNITASPLAGIDPNEAFDVSPYANDMFRYFLRNPICQEMGRKFKIAFSSSDEDTGMTWFHDLGFIPRIDANGERGFKVLIGGGLGSLPQKAFIAYEFLHEDKIIPFTEAVLRVFDRHGERANRNKARMKFLIKKVGIEQMMKWIEEEQKSLKTQKYVIAKYPEPIKNPVKQSEIPSYKIENEANYVLWKETNVRKQKQNGLYAAFLKIQLGNIDTKKARLLADWVSHFAADDIRITADQNLLLRDLTEDSLPYLFSFLEQLNLADAGYDSTADITACPGTDTCNLGISNSTAVSVELENVIRKEFPQLIKNNNIKIKISGCMNSCGQHGMANIGFHGSSFKKGDRVAPALQLLMAGGTLGNGEGAVAEKVLKVPSKRAPEAVRQVLEDYFDHAKDGEYFNDYYHRAGGKRYFYKLLKPLADTDNLTDEEYVDWGHLEEFEKEVGVGECAGIIIDLVSTLLLESEEKLEWAQESLTASCFADSIYHSYSSFVSTAKALLLDKDVKVKNHFSVLEEFDKQYVKEAEFSFPAASFTDWVMRMKTQQPEEDFARNYFKEASAFLEEVRKYRSKAEKINA